MISPSPSNTLATSRDPDTARQRVETGTEGFTTGRQFRAFHEFDPLLVGESFVIKVATPINITLFDLALNIDSGSVRYYSVVGGTEGGTFSPVQTIFPKNNRDDRPSPFYVSQVSVSIGGTVTGGVVTDIARIKTGTNKQRSSVLEQTQSIRGVSPNTYYLVIENNGNSDATGVFYAFWEE